MKTIPYFVFFPLVGLFTLGCKGSKTSAPKPQASSASGTQGQTQTGSGTLPPNTPGGTGNSTTPPPVTPPPPTGLPEPSEALAVAKEAERLIGAPMDLLFNPTLGVEPSLSEVEAQAEACANRFVEKATVAVATGVAKFNTPDTFTNCMQEKTLTAEGKGRYEFRHDFSLSFTCNKDLGALDGASLSNGAFSKGLCAQGSGNFAFSVTVQTQELTSDGAVTRRYKRSKVLTGTAANTPCVFTFSGGYRTYQGCQWSDSVETLQGPKSVLIVTPETSLKALPAPTGTYFDGGRAPFTFNGRQGALVYNSNGHITWSLAGASPQAEVQKGDTTQVAPKPQLTPEGALGAQPTGTSPAGVPSGCDFPAEPLLPQPTVTVGTGTAQSCTQEALQQALEGGGSITFQCGSQPVQIRLTKELVVGKDTALNGGNLVTLDGQNNTRILNVQPQIRFTLRNITLRGGRAKATATVPSSGGALFGGWKSVLDVRNVVFEKNAAGIQGDEGGGAIYVKSESTAIVANSTFFQNTAGTGGAINSVLSQLTVVNSSFIANASTAGGPAGSGYGAAIYTDGASGKTDDSVGGEVRICGSNFLNNTGSGQGGAAFLFVYPPDSIVVEKSHFEGNSVEKNSKGDAVGGALRLGNGVATLSRVSFVGNVAQSQGGALWVDGTKPVAVENCTFAQNRAVDSNDPTSGLGGGVAGGYLTLNHVTFWKNQAGYMGGALWGADKVVLKNSVMVENTAGNSARTQQHCGSPVAEGGGNLEFPGPLTQEPNDKMCSPQARSENPNMSGLVGFGLNKLVMPNPNTPIKGLGQGCLPVDGRGQHRPAQGCTSGAVEL